MMQLDDVVDAKHDDPDRFEEARHRTVRWLDRCIKAHTRPDKQNLFPIVQGGYSIMWGHLSFLNSPLFFNNLGIWCEAKL